MRLPALALLAVALPLLLLAPRLPAQEEQSAPPADPHLAPLIALRDRIGARIREVDRQLPLDQGPLRVGRAPEDKPPLPIEFPVESSAVTVEIPGVAGPRELEYAVPRAAMERIVRGDLQTVALIRSQLAEDVSAARISAAVGERIDAALERAARQSGARERMRTPLAKKLRIETSVNLLRLRYAAKRSRKGARSERRQTAAALAKEAFEVSGAPSRSVLTLPAALDRTPPSADAPSLRVAPVAALRIRPRSPDAIRRPKGVKIAIDEAMLGRVLRAQGLDAGIEELLRLEDGLLEAATATEAFCRLQAYMGAKKAEFVRRFMTMRDLGRPRMVSLAALLAQLDRYRNRWTQRPEELRLVGGLTRIFGYLRDPASGDLLLVGRAEPGAPPILLDDLSVGVRAVWRDGRTPTVSLEPEGNNLAGLHRAIIAGVPGDSPFALAMLEADYRMKGVLCEAEGSRVDIEGFETLIDSAAKSGAEALAARFWLSPVQPTARSVMLGPGGSSALFNARVQVLTEDALVSGAGMTFTGRSDPAHLAAARSFSANYDAIAARHPEFQRLRGLFDIVMLARVLRLTAPGDETLEALCALPYDPAKVPSGYPGLVVEHRRGGRTINYAGGCDLDPRARWRTLMEAGTKDQAQLAAAAGGRTGIATDLSGLTLRVPDTSAAEGTPDRLLVTALRMFIEGRFDEADELLTRAVEDDRSFAKGYALRASVRFASGRRQAGLWDGAQAVSLAPGDTRLQATFYRLLLAAGVPDALAEAPPAARKAIAALYLRAAGLLALSPDEGRRRAATTALQTALKADPRSAEAYSLRSSLRLEFDGPDAALADANRALHIEPENTAALFRRAAAYQAKQDYASAHQDFTAALELNRSDPLLRAACLEGRARIRMLQNNLLGAGQDATDAIEIMPKYWRPHATRGMAIFGLATALPKDPKDLQSKRRFYGYSVKALASIENALRLGPADSREFQAARTNLRALRKVLRGILKR